jgi:hypothetical protein
MDCAKIVSDNVATTLQWKETCEACKYATYFHTSQWVALFSSFTKNKIVADARKIIFKDNYSVILPLARRDYLKGSIKTYLSSPAGTFGGWLSSDPLTRSHSQALVNYMLGFGNIFWRENPYDPLLHEMTIPGSIEEFTQTIDLTKSVEVLQKASSRAHVKAINKARREGVIVTEAQDLDDWKEHFRLYEKSVIRWKNAGTAKKPYKPYSWDLFKLIFDKGPPHCKLWCARCKGKLAASVLCFYWNQHAVAWHGSANEEFFDVRPNNFLYQHMILHARENDYHWFDCNTPGGLNGVVEFKDHLGTQRLSSRFLDKTSITRKIVRAVRRYI